MGGGGVERLGTPRGQRVVSEVGEADDRDACGVATGRTGLDLVPQSATSESDDEKRAEAEGYSQWGEIQSMMWSASSVPVSGLNPNAMESASTNGSRRLAGTNEPR